MLLPSNYKIMIIKHYSIFTCPSNFFFLVKTYLPYPYPDFAFELGSMIQSQSHELNVADFNVDMLAMVLDPFMTDIRHMRRQNSKQQLKRFAPRFAEYVLSSLSVYYFLEHPKQAQAACFLIIKELSQLQNVSLFFITSMSNRSLELDFLKTYVFWI